MARQDPTNDACLVVLVIGASVLAGVSYLLSEAVRWLV